MLNIGLLETHMNRIKQVILIRKDLTMRRGKEIAQGSHASMAFLVEQLTNAGFDDTKTQDFTITLTDIEKNWLTRMAPLYAETA